MDKGHGDDRLASGALEVSGGAQPTLEQHERGGLHNGTVAALDEEQRTAQDVGTYTHHVPYNVEDFVAPSLRIQQLADPSRDKEPRTHDIHGVSSPDDGRGEQMRK
ncbi:hypothetical protein E2C01_060194 [Portunus trituberculatus]|uniref:Uncharacterized protein n=1 Tax=Portunus trituberculatus TaxID=210409 RepID=A0A5B7H0B8_PORTR|nr:hypothetical protein [Portunus trituberculatus]